MTTSVRRTAAQIYRDYNEAENRHDLAATTSLVAVDLKVEVNGVRQVSSGADDERAMAVLYAHYPDYRRVIKHIVEGVDEAAVVWEMRGTPTLVDGFLALPLLVSGVSVVKSDGKVLTEASLFADSSALNKVLSAAQQEKQETQETQQT